MTNTIQIFVDYNAEENVLAIFDEFNVFIKPAEKKNNFNIYHFGMNVAGANEEKEREKYIKKADVIILLLSPAFLIKDFFSPYEQMFLDRTLCIIPVIVKQCLWRYTEFKNHIILPRNETPINQWIHKDKAFSEILDELIKVIEKLRTTNTNDENILNNQSTKIAQVRQVVTIDTFIAEYHRQAKGIATQLDNTFLGRKKEIGQLTEMFHSVESDFILVTGLAGVGKTRLVLEGLKEFLKENSSFHAYCISDKHHELGSDELNQHLDSSKNFILFIDDANRVKYLQQILGFYKTVRSGKLKIIMTVRDYAFDEVNRVCLEYQPIKFKINRLTDEQIEAIIEAEPFKITDHQSRDRIAQIADGNPRIAIMAAQLAQKQNIYALNDVADVFEKYFSTFVKDNGAFNLAINIKCLGLIAFFYTISLSYKDRENTTTILNSFDIQYTEFINAIKQLHKLELVFIQYDFVKIPEQNLATFFFYKAFIKDELLSFETLLNNYIHNYHSRFRDSITPTYSMFNAVKVNTRLKPFLDNYWKEVKYNQEEAFEFLSLFWYYLKEDTIAFLYDFIKELPQEVENKMYNLNEVDKYNRIVELLSNFFQYPSPQFKDALELGFSFIRKRPSYTSKLLSTIREQIKFEERDEDYKYEFQRQLDLFEILIRGLGNGDTIKSAFFYELAKAFLKFDFEQTTRLIPNRQFTIWSYTIPNSSAIRSLREKIWKAVDTHFKTYFNESFEILQHYLDVSNERNEGIIAFETTFVAQIFDKYLSPNSFTHCNHVQVQLNIWFKQYKIENKTFSVLAQRFTNPTYELFLKINQNKSKESEIRKSFVFQSKYDIDVFYEIFSKIKAELKDNRNNNDTLDFIVDENLNQNFRLGIQLLIKVVEHGNEINYTPNFSFKNHLTTKEKASRIWSIIQCCDFQNKSQWEISFYERLESSLVNKEYSEALVKTICSKCNNQPVFAKRLNKFISFNPTLPQIILKSIFEKNKQGNLKIKIWGDFFTDYFNQLGDDLELIKQAYLQQENIGDYFDSPDNGLFNILKKDSTFLFDYVSNLHSRKQLKRIEYKNFSFIWQLDNIEAVLKQIFDIKKKTFFGDECIKPNPLTSFFRNLEGKQSEQAKNFLKEYCKQNFSDANKMNCIVHVALKSFEDFFEEILLLFLSLNQDVAIFSKILWEGNEGAYLTGGNVTVGNLLTKKWENIQNIVERSDIGIKLVPIKQYVAKKIAENQKRDREERKRRGGLPMWG